ncbi:MAG: alpha/beta hydrolase [Oscillospiraceae bacterium]|nr:alpha/beta hydrolase [Oscillospiraceae bacterium]
MISLQVPYEKANLKAPEHPAVLQPFCLPHTDELGVKKRPAVVICPGGGYDFCSARESDPVAMRFAGYGVQAFILYYNCRNPFPANLLELAAAVAYVRSHAEEYEVDPNRIAVCGFSAGAHLAGSLAVYWNQPMLTELLGDSAAYRPNAQILCYPVISGGMYAHRGSIVNLVGTRDANDYECAQNAAVSLEKQVSADTPPCFLWHTSDDNCVPVQNSILYMSALAEKGIPFEAHIYPHGAHGLSLSDETAASGEWHLNPVCEPWFPACIQWIRRVYQ